MEPRKLDKLDFVIALALFVAVAAWASLWRLPYPHPDQWGYVVSMAHIFRPSILALAGYLAIGLFASVMYILFCSFTRNSEVKPEDIVDDVNELGDLSGNFMYTRFSPICGALSFALASPAWHGAQYASPGFLLVLAGAASIVLWKRGGIGRSYVMYTIGMLTASIVAGVTPLGFLLVAGAFVLDVSAHWDMTHGLYEKSDSFRKKVSRTTSELLSLLVIVPVGFLIGAYVLARTNTIGMADVDLGALARSWMGDWTQAPIKAIGDNSLYVIIGAVAAGWGGLAIGGRIRESGDTGVTACILATFFLALFTIVLAFRSIDKAERERLLIIHEYARLVVDDAQGADWLFTDGRLDEAIRLELAMRGDDTVVMDMMSVPSGREAARLRMLAPEIGDRDIFEAGGAEVLRAWASERPYMLEKAAWQLGEKMVDRYGKVRQFPHGMLLRTESTEGNAEANAKCEEWTIRLLAALETRPFFRSLFGGVDSRVNEKLDAIAWRAARMADIRAVRYAAELRAVDAEREREVANRLDRCNASLKRQGQQLDKMLQSGKIVLTADEALGIALKRADFDLARHYAAEVLSVRPDDAAANFAIGMYEMNLMEYAKAARRFEKALDSRPNEPATLNNLAIAYVKQGKKERALECAEAAAKILPDSPEIRHTLEELRK